MKRWDVSFELPFAEIKTWVWAEDYFGARDMAEKMISYEYGIDRTHFIDVPWEADERPWDAEEQAVVGVSHSG